MIKLKNDSKVEIPPRRVTENVDLSHVSFLSALPANEIKIHTTIPNGTAVAVQDAPQIDYIWLDGEVVPKTNEAMLKIARGGHKFMPGVREPRFWLMAAGLLLIILGLTLKGKTMIKQWRET